MYYKSPSFVRPNPSKEWARTYARMELSLPTLPETEKLTTSVTRVLGGNPSKVSLHDMTVIAATDQYSAHSSHFKV